MSLVALLLAVAPISAMAATSSPNDPFFAAGDQWALAGAPGAMNVPPAWCVSTGRGVLVADLDTGVDFGHPELAGKLVAGARFTSGAGDPSHPDGVGAAEVQDDVGHGTETTGVMVALTNNRQGIAAVAPDARALVMKVLAKAPQPDEHGLTTGTGHPADLDAAIQWSVDHGARVLNISIGGGGSSTQGVSQNFSAAVHNASARGAAVVIAAGNGGQSIVDYRSVNDVALVVAGVGPTGEPAYYSKPAGPGTNIFAPGGDETQGAGPSDALHNQLVTTALGGGYVSAEGTSVAAPMVAGAVADLMATGLSAAQARQRLLATAVTRAGVPQVDLGAAIGAHGPCGRPPATAPAPPPVSPAPSPTPSPSPTPTPSPSPSPSLSPSPSPSIVINSRPAGHQGKPQIPVLPVIALVVAAGLVARLGWTRYRG